MIAFAAIPNASFASLRGSSRKPTNVWFLGLNTSSGKWVLLWLLTEA